MDIAFMGRQQELKRMDDLWHRGSAQLMFLYGRRRVGKTALMVEWMRRSSQRTLYWAATSTSATAQLQDFSQAVYGFSNPGLEVPAEFTYASWQQVFEVIARLAQEQKFALFIDEFDAIHKVNPSLAGKLQHIWDHHLSRANLLFGISATHLGLVKREFLSYQAPLYGRASAQFYLRPFFFGQTRLFFPRFSAEDRMTLYAIFGGVPAYWKRIDPSKPLSHSIQKELLTPDSLMQTEPRLLLQDYVTESHHYNAILSAIANGAHTIKSISDAAGLPKVNPPKYISVLADAGFVERRVPVTEAGPSRGGRYHITDPYLHFYFRFLAGRRTQLALGEQEQALAEITGQLGDFIGQHTWEDICREWIIRAGAASILPDWPEQVGSAWNSRTQVDIAGINWMDKTLILGECEWTDKPADETVMEILVREKAPQVIPARGNWKIHFLGFSKSGWTDSATNFRDEINQHPPKGDHWISTGMQLINLERLDDDLSGWTARVENREIEC